MKCNVAQQLIKVNTACQNTTNGTRSGVRTHADICPLEKGDQMAALPATVGGLSVDIPVGTVRRALAIAELSGSDTVSITISLERLVDLTQTVAGLVGQQLDEAVVQEKMSSDVEPGDGSENRGGGCFGGTPC